LAAILDREVRHEGQMIRGNQGESVSMKARPLNFELMIEIDVVKIQQGRCEHFFGLLCGAESGGFVVGNDLEITIDVEFVRKPE